MVKTGGSNCGQTWALLAFIPFSMLLLIIESVDANRGTLILKNTQGFPGSSVVKNQFSSVQFSHSVVSNSLWPHGLQHARPPCLLSTPELTQTHVHWIGDTIQPSHPLTPPSPSTFNLSQHQGLFKWVSSSHQVAKVLESQLQHQSFQWIFRTDFL